MIKNFQYVLLLISIMSYGVRADDCPYSIQDASVILTLPNQTNMKIVSSTMCNQKAYFVDRFIDADVEIWKTGKLVGKFYSRKVSYDLKTLKLMLQGAILTSSDVIQNKKIENSKLFIIDLKKSKLNSSNGELVF